MNILLFICFDCLPIFFCSKQHTLNMHRRRLLTFVGCRSVGQSNQLICIPKCCAAVCSFCCYGSTQMFYYCLFSILDYYHIFIKSPMQKFYFSFATRKINYHKCLHIKIVFSQPDIHAIFFLAKAKIRTKITDNEIKICTQRFETGEFILFDFFSKFFHFKTFKNYKNKI